ncbi:long-chain fatty acid--CoA ligase [Selenomonas sp. TAMA-11512]|uniref:AMP-binding protein n=1 Tax=Selenomonas sp. TAMA-11512 TaxID=3095337 RepID=UPI00308DEA51|nr:long-chain fatty acid--CoA ligase [Selenomonas sp. TAMA-11512]
MNYYKLLQAQAVAYGNKPFLCMDARVFSYASFLSNVDALAEELEDFHIRGDVIIYSEDFIEEASLFFALQRIGARPLAAHAGVMDSLARRPTENIAGILTMRQGEVSWSPRDTTENVSSPEGCMGVFTSGSTGAPKVLYRTYASWAAFFPVQNAAFRIGEESRLYLHGSLGFTGNLNVFLAVLYRGATLVTTAAFQPKQVYHLLSESGVDVVYLVPNKLRLLVQAKEAPIQGIQSVFTGSQLLSEELLQSLRRSFPAAHIFLYYGASELNYITYRELEGEGFDERNLGRPFENVKLEVRDSLIYVTTPYRVSNVKCPFALGDLGTLDEKGNLRLLGRRSDVVNKGGYKISLAALKEKLEKMQGVEAAEVLGYEDSRRYEEAAAFLVLERSVERGPIEKRIRKELPAVERPKKLFYLNEIPINDRGKADKERLRSYIFNGS